MIALNLLLYNLERLPMAASIMSEAEVSIFTTEEEIASRILKGLPSLFLQISYLASMDSDFKNKLYRPHDLIGSLHFISL